MKIMTNPIVDQGQVLRVKPIMNDRSYDLMGHDIPKDITGDITLMSKSANDNKKDNECDIKWNDITPDPCALLKALKSINNFFGRSEYDDDDEPDR